MPKGNKAYLTAGLFLLVFILGFSGLAQADNVTVSGMSYGHTVYFSRGEQVTGWYWSSGHMVFGTYWGNYTQEQGVTAEMNLLIGDMAKTGYCVDLDQSIGSNHTYDMGVYGPYDGPFTDSATGLTTDQFLDIAWVLQNYAPGLATTSPESYSEKDIITAVQMVTWEIAYEEQDYYSLSSGSWRLREGNNLNSMTLANSILGEIPDNLTADMFPGYGVVTSDGVQDLVFGGTSSTATPEPGTMLLFGTCMAGMAWVRRRKSLKVKKG